MDQQLKQAKQTIRWFLQEHYTDEKLCQLLAHAQSGRLSYYSCCCLVGIATADHPLQGFLGWDDTDSECYELPYADTHYAIPFMTDYWLSREAEGAFSYLGEIDDDNESDELRCRRLIPIVKAEIRRRERARSLGYVMKAIESEVAAL